MFETFRCVKACQPDQTRRRSGLASETRSDAVQERTDEIAGCGREELEYRLRNDFTQERRMGCYCDNANAKKQEDSNAGQGAGMQMGCEAKTDVSLRIGLTFESAKWNVDMSIRKPRSWRGIPMRGLISDCDRNHRKTLRMPQAIRDARKLSMTKGSAARAVNLGPSGAFIQQDLLGERLERSARAKQERISSRASEEMRIMRRWEEKGKIAWRRSRRAGTQMRLRPRHCSCGGCGRLVD